MSTNSGYTKKFNTKKQSILGIWDEVQRLQTDFCFPQEISAYYLSEFWVDRAQTVLDVGTGNGYFLEKVAGLFPDKEYTAIDISAEFIQIAKTEVAYKNIEFLVNNYLDLEGQFDFIIMRLFWQHLKNTEIAEAFTQMERLTKSGGSVLIVDAFDEARMFVPDLPEFRKVISAYTRQQRDNADCDREVVKTIRNWACENDNWRIGLDIPFVMPSTIPGHLQLYQRVYDLWIALFEHLGELEIDFEPAKKELGDWKNVLNAFTQAGIRVMRLDRIA